MYLCCTMRLKEMKEICMLLIPISPPHYNCNISIVFVTTNQIQLRKACSYTTTHAMFWITFAICEVDWSQVVT